MKNRNNQVAEATQPLATTTVTPVNASDIRSNQVVITRDRKTAALYHVWTPERRWIGDIKKVVSNIAPWQATAANKAVISFQKRSTAALWLQQTFEEYGWHAAPDAALAAAFERAEDRKIAAQEEAARALVTTPAVPPTPPVIEESATALPEAVLARLRAESDAALAVLDPQRLAEEAELAAPVAQHEGEVPTTNERRWVKEPYHVNGHVVRYSARLREWIVDELHYFKTKDEAFASVAQEAAPAASAVSTVEVTPAFAPEVK